MADQDFEQKFKVLVDKHKQGFIVGLAEVTGEVAPRQEIDTLLLKEEDVFNLLILGFRELKHKGEKDIMGYFQIAAIHGYPLTPWNKIIGKMAVPDDNNRPNSDGYCPHSKNTFPTWHRPYLVMLEQALFIEMVNIAQRYDEPSRSKYLAAAKKFRLPYWDYWRPRGPKAIYPGVGEGDEVTYDYDFSAPRIFTDEQVMVKMWPSEKSTPIKNPFWNFIFSHHSGSLRENEWAYMDVYQTTKDEKTGTTTFNNLINRSQTTRHPYPVPSQVTIQDTVWDNPVRLNTVLNEMRMDANRIALKMLGKSPNVYGYYELFSCTTGFSQSDPDLDHPNSMAPAEKGQEDQETTTGLIPPDDHEAYRKHMTTSLEGLHNMYHIMIGGLKPGGHMSRVPTSAFDPIFWFHHNQIERIFTIWQSIHEGEKGAWFENPKHAQSDLLPFLRGPADERGYNNFWTSDLVKSTTTFGYTYSDIVKDQPQKTVEWIQQLYGWSCPAGNTGKGLKPPPGLGPLDLSKSPFFNLPQPQLSAQLSDILKFRLDKPRSDIQMLTAQLDSLAVESVEDPLPDETTIWEWEICDQVQRLALNGAFAILYFVMKEDGAKLPDESPETAPTLAGITNVFASPTEGCANCRDQRDNNVVMRNAVNITSQLMDYVRFEQLPSLAPDHVVPFLKRRLKWQVVDANGGVRDPRDMQQKYGFRLTVTSTQSTVGQRKQGEYPAPQQYPDIFREIIDNAKGQQIETQYLAA